MWLSGWLVELILFSENNLCNIRAYSNGIKSSSYVISPNTVKRGINSYYYFTDIGHYVATTLIQYFLLHVMGNDVSVVRRKL